MTVELRILKAHGCETQWIWRSLEHRAHPSYFLTWPWISNWLTCLPRDEAPSLAVISDRGTPIAACFLGRRWVLRHHLLPARAVFLNATGLPDRDELCVEHNGLLRVPGVEVSLAQLAGLLPPDWDELVLPAVDSDAFGALEAGPYRVLVDREVAAPFVDLGAVRAAGDYLSLISHKTRGQIRRARRELGPCRVEVATDLATAMSIFDELVTLHAAQWREKGQPGAFADPWIAHFHRTLIQQRLQHGEIQLLRVRTRDRTVGCTYGLVAHGRVLVYQSGFARFDDPHVKPGYVCHAAGIEHAAAAGHAVYDPLGGDARYKESLSTGSTRMVWLRIQRRLPRFTLDELLRSWKHGRAAASAWPAAPAPP